MAEMTERELAQKVVHDKQFLRELAFYFPTDEDEGEAKTDGEGEPQAEGESNAAFGELIANAARDMGIEGIDPVALDAALTEEISTLGGLKKIKLLGTFINAGRKAKKKRH